MEKLLEEWRCSSPWEENRLAILEKLALCDNWQQQLLFDRNEQREFAIDNDEFVIYTKRYKDFWGKGSVCWKCLIYLAVIGLGCIFFEKIALLLTGRNIFGNFSLYIFGVSFLLILPMVIVNLCTFIKRNNVLVTNRKLYFSSFGKRNELRLSCLEVKSSIDMHGIRKRKRKERYKNDSPYVIADLFFYQRQWKADRPIFKVNAFADCLYLLQVISCTASICNSCCYVYPILCDFSSIDKRKKAFLIMLLIVTLFTAPPISILFFLLLFPAEPLYKSFHDKKDLINFLKKNEGEIYNNLLAALQGEFSFQKKFFEIKAGRNIFLSDHNICFSRKYIWVKKNNREVIKDSVDNIFIKATPCFFTIYFKNIDVTFYSRKKYIFIPFVDMVDYAINKSIVSYASYGLYWEN